MLEYNEKKSVVVGLKDKLQEKITEYTTLTEKGKEYYVVGLRR